MSIYSTLWKLIFPKNNAFLGSGVEVRAQAVPANVGHPRDYPDGDPFSEFLPPALTSDQAYEGIVPRAVVFVTEDATKGTERSGQEFEDPLLVLTGAQYISSTFDELHGQLEAALKLRYPKG